MRRLYLRTDEFINRFHSLLILCLAEKKVIVIVEAGSMGRYDLVNLDDLIDGISVSSFVVKRLERLRNLTCLKSLDGSN